MAKTDHEFETRFFEGVLKHNPDYREVIELLGGFVYKAEAA